MSIIRGRQTICNPYLFAVFLLAVFVTVELLAGVIIPALSQSALVQIAVADIILAVIGVKLLTSLGWWELSGYTRLIRIRDLPLLALPFIVSLFSFTEPIAVTAPVAVAGFAIFSILIGFSEETFFRGLMLSGLRPVGLLQAACISAFLFAAPHLLNILSGFWDPAFALADTLSAFGIGVTFAALRFRTGSIWPLVGLHALTDFSAFLILGGVEVTAQTTASLTVSVLAGIGLAGYGLFLLRGMRE
jgi:membrane protease YdiL (CAAX protease family)